MKVTMDHDRRRAEEKRQEKNGGGEEGREKVLATERLTKEAILIQKERIEASTGIRNECVVVPTSLCDQREKRRHEGERKAISEERGRRREKTWKRTERGKKEKESQPVRWNSKRE